MYHATLSPEDAYTLIEQGAQLVDVRRPHEYARNALPGSVNIPLQVIQQANRQLHKETPVLLYCNNGQRSGTAMHLLQACGFSRVHNLGSYCNLTGRAQKNSSR